MHELDSMIVVGSFQLGMFYGLFYTTLIQDERSSVQLDQIKDEIQKDVLCPKHCNLGMFVNST